MTWSSSREKSRPLFCAGSDVKYPQVYPGTGHYVVNFGSDAYKNREWRTQWRIVVNRDDATCQTCQKAGYRGLCAAVRVVRHYIKSGGQPAAQDTSERQEQSIGDRVEAMLARDRARQWQPLTEQDKYWAEVRRSILAGALVREAQSRLDYQSHLGI